MSKKKREYIFLFDDILEAIRKIESYFSGLSYDDFCQNPMVVDAIIRNFEIIGEAANKIPKEIRDKYTDVEWKQVIGFRNILIHDYFDIDLEAVWDTIKMNIPDFKLHIESALKSER